MLDISGILFIGTAVFFGFLLGKATHWIKLTAIVGYILAGILLGPVMGLVVLPGEVGRIVINFTLAFVAFIIGVGFTKSFLQHLGMVVVKVTLIQSLLTFVIVAIGVYFIAVIMGIGYALPLAIIFGALGLATAPAGTVATLHECRAHGRFAQLTIGIVGLDDAVAVLIFVIGLAVVRLLLGGEISLWPILEAVGIEIGVAIAIGVALGIALSYLTRYLRNHEDIFIAAVGLILLCGGIAEVLGASLIMACMILGVTFTNITPREGKLIQDNIESVIPVIFVIFFVTAGLELQPALMMSLGLLGIIYVISRIIGKHFGAYIGCMAGKTDTETRNYLGLALLSQAGVAIGLAIIVSHELRGLPGGETLGAIAVSVITATTVIFEIVGPIGVRFAVTRVQGRSKRMEDKIAKKLRRMADEVDVFESDVEYQPLIYSRDKSDIDEILINGNPGTVDEKSGSPHTENGR